MKVCWILPLLAILSVANSKIFEDVPDNVHLRKDSEINLMEIMESLAPVTDESDASFKSQTGGIERFRRRVEPSNAATSLTNAVNSSQNININDISGTPPSGDGEFDSGSGSSEEVKRDKIVGEAAPAKPQNTITAADGEPSNSSLKNSTTVKSENVTANQPVQKEELKADEAAFIASLHKAAEQKKKQKKLPGSLGEDDEMDDEENESSMNDESTSTDEGSSEEDEEGMGMVGKKSNVSTRSNIFHPPSSGEKEEDMAPTSTEDASASGSEIDFKKDDVVKVESGNGVPFISGAGNFDHDSESSGESNSDEETLPGSVGAVSLASKNKNINTSLVPEVTSGSQTQKIKIDLVGTNISKEPRLSLQKNEESSTSGSGSLKNKSSMVSDLEQDINANHLVSGDSDLNEETLPGSEGAMSSPTEEENLMSLNTPAVQQSSATGQDAYQNEESGSGNLAKVTPTETQKTTSKNVAEELLPGSLGAISNLESLTSGSDAMSSTSNSSGSDEVPVKTRARSTIFGEPEQVVSSASGLDESVTLSSTSGEGYEQSMSLKSSSSDNQLLPGSVGAAEGPNLMSMNTPNVDVSGSGKEVEQIYSGDMITSGNVGSASGESEVTVTPLLSKKDTVTGTSGDNASGQ